MTRAHGDARRQVAGNFAKLREAINPESNLSWELIFRPPMSFSRIKAESLAHPRR